MGNFDRGVQAPGPAQAAEFRPVCAGVDPAIAGHGVTIAPAYIVENDVSRKRLVEVSFSPEPPTEHLFVC